MDLIDARFGRGSCLFENPCEYVTERGQSLISVVYGTDDITGYEELGFCILVVIRLLLLLRKEEGQRGQSN